MANTPAATLIGQWCAGSNGTFNACCVVVGPDTVITTRHQGGGVGTTVVVGGTSYTVSREWTDATDPNTPDLRVDELAGAHFSQYARINAAGGEVGKNLTLVVGGYGMGRGATLYQNGDPNVPYGYAWDGSTAPALRWGNATLDGQITNFHTGSPFYTYTNLLSSPFIGPSKTTLADEAAIAQYDSGSGWFLNAGGSTWSVAGLSDSVTRGGQIDWTDPANPDANPDHSYIVQISAYSTWINGVLASVPEPSTLVPLALGGIVASWRRRRP
jgi:hypothetical protein